MRPGDVAGDPQTQPGAPSSRPREPSRRQKGSKTLLRSPVGDRNRHRRLGIRHLDVRFAPLAEGVVEQIADTAIERDGSAPIGRLKTSGA